MLIIDLFEDFASRDTAFPDFSEVNSRSLSVVRINFVDVFSHIENNKIIKSMH